MFSKSPLSDLSPKLLLAGRAYHISKLSARPGMLLNAPRGLFYTQKEAGSVQVDHANMAPNIKEDPDSLPPPVVGTRIKGFETDGNHLISRPGGHFLNSPTDLGLFEKFDLADNLRKWVKTEYPKLNRDIQPEAININAEDRTNFFNEPAYFGVGLSSGKGEDRVTFDVKDESNQIAAAQYVEWDTDDDIDELKRRALTKWERSERARIREFNQKRIFISSQNYIIRAAKAGFAEGSRPPIAPPEFVELAEPTSAFAIFKKLVEANLKIVQGVEASLRLR
ncbi:uncharacterized protein LW94_12010 [Fusarium fujikuroi]|nr:uncharacterized protein LW94_12010 [Fusarium fujikuroi]KLP01422.1 uncharacterized protein Y057_9394 [Fusarium fujikuroi]